MLAMIPADSGHRAGQFEELPDSLAMPWLDPPVRYRGALFGRARGPCP